MTYRSDPVPDFATNGVMLVTAYEGGYAITNAYCFTAGSLSEPQIEFSVSCPEVMFLNDDPVVTNYLERVYRVSLSLRAPEGVGGTVVVSCSGGTGSQLFLDERRATPLGPGRIALGVPAGGGYASDFTCTTNVYLVSPHVGNGEIQATLSLSDGGGTHGQTKPYRVIEPLRRLVTTEEYDGRIVNPSRLVWGTNAVLKVGVGEGSPFEATNVVWSVVSNSPGRVVPIDGWHAIVEPTAPSGKVVVEARFNDDPIQPCFVLPIVERRVVPVKAFVVEPPSSEYAKRWENGEIQRNITLANKIFAQVGVEFELMHIQRYVRSSDFWHLTYKQWYPLSGGRWYEDLSEQLCYLLDYYNKNDCIELYFIGDLSDPKVAGLKTEHGLIITRKATFQTIAHELGHALGLHDCYFRAGEQLIENGRQPINGGHFLKLAQDWGDESGRGFFEKKDSLVRMISSVLMCGVSDRKRVDIPYGSLYGLTNGRVYHEGYVIVGAGFIKPTNKEVFSK